MSVARRIALAGLVALTPLAALAQGTGIQPGQWEITVTVNSMEMPGAPPQVAELMKGKATTLHHCLTPEEAARGPQDMLKTSKSCNFTHYSMADGKLESEMVCTQGGSTITATGVGTFTPTGFTAESRAVMTGGMSMTTISTSVGRRVGECRN